MPITRRTLLGAAGLAAGSGPWIIARAAETLTVAAYGGEYRDIFIRTVIEPFEKKFSVKVEYDDSGGVDPYPRIRASQGSPGFDVAAEMVPSTIILAACRSGDGMFSLANKTDSGPLGRCLCATEDWVYEAGFGDFTHAHALKATLLRS